MYMVNIKFTGLIHDLDSADAEIEVGPFNTKIEAKVFFDRNFTVSEGIGAEAEVVRREDGYYLIIMTSAPWTGYVRKTLIKR